MASKTDGLMIDGSVTAYWRQLHQWIMWMPPVKDVTPFWAPVNVNTVKSRGIESRLNVIMTQRQVELKCFTGIDLTWSTFEEDLPEFRIVAGDQLFYVPVENMLAGAQVNVAGWQARYQHHWFGASPGINDDVQAGNVGAFTIARDWVAKAVRIATYVHVDNTWDVPYRLIERRPMPGRSIKGGIQVAF
jgi:iron complex outermembrane receptor protein